MELLPEAAGPQEPLATTSPRRAGSVRRTTNIDTARPDGLAADAIVDARARDLRTNLDGTTDVVAVASLRARISPGRELLELETSPAVPALVHLLGASVGPGFRSRVNELVTDGCAEGSLLYLLLDDMTGATLVSGYALHRGGALDPPSADSHPVPELENSLNPQVNVERSATAPAVASPPPRVTVSGVPLFTNQSDICAGWAHDATMMLHLRDTGRLPVPVGPTAPTLEREDDPLSWHAMAPLSPHGVRRRRRLDLAAPGRLEGEHQVEMHFRDSHVDEGGHETIMHEYSLTGTVDPGAGRVGSVSARVQVLPWIECPAALASAQRIDGMELAQLRPRVRKEFVGRSTCTHLNDCLRSLADVTALSRELQP
jgi:hypothetical protein